MNDQPTGFPKIELWQYRLEQQEQKIADLETHVEVLGKLISDRETQRIAQERRQLLAGVSFLGSVVIALAGIIWSYRSVIFRGAQ